MLTLVLFSKVPLPHAKSLILAVCLIVAWNAPRFGEPFFATIEKLGARFAARKRLAIIAISVAVILVRLSVLPWFPLPIPFAQDEFGYLLSADTFAHGRLTNPPHPLWIFFDTFQVNQHPTYMSRYPPAQGLVLALGQLLGHPWIGVVLSVSAMCGAILWMLQSWLPPAWALLGAIFVFLRIGILSYWMNSYWGGAVAAIGGALVMGALSRIRDHQRPRDAVLLGLGVGILANSRPVEGFIFFLPVAIALGMWLFGRHSPSWRLTLPRVVLPICIVIIFTGAFIGYYNWRVTGNPLLPPFVLNQRTYFRGQPVFIWQKKLAPVHTLNAQFDAYYNIFPGGFDGTWHGLMFVSWKKAVKFRDFFLFMESALLVPLLALPWLMRDRKMRLFAAQVIFSLLAILTVLWFLPHYALAVASTLPLLSLLWLLRDREVDFLVKQLVFFFAGLCTVVAFLEHYAAPVAATFFVLLMQALRHLRKWEHRGRPVGIGLSRVVALFVIGVLPFQIVEGIRNPGATVTAPTWSRQRAQTEAQLKAMPGEHLVIVRYAPGHGYEAEFVYNLADIDHAKVVWAREIPGVNVQPLLDYFRERHIWLFEPDLSPPRLPIYPLVPD
jgi:hypothetical protein